MPIEAKSIRGNEFKSLPRGGRRGSFIEQTLVNLIWKMERALFAEDLARSNGFLQTLDPRVKIIGLLALILSVSFSRNIFTILIIFTSSVILAVFSGIPIRVLAARAWLGALTFTGLIAVPVIFTTPGETVFQLPLLKWTITAQGLTSAAYLLTRVETTVTLSVLLVLCTLWTHILKALRILQMPVVFVVILGMTYRYLFVMLETAHNMFESRRSRQVGRFSGKESRRIVSSTIGVLLIKSFNLNTEIYLAMQSRGFRGEVYTLDEFTMRRRDWLALGGFLAFAVFTFWLGRQDSLESLVNFKF